MPCRLLFDSLSTPVSGSIINVILSFPDTILYLKANKKKKKRSITIIMFYNAILLKGLKTKYLVEKS